MVPEVCGVEVAVEKATVVPGRGGESREETENYHHKHLSLGSVEEEY